MISRLALNRQSIPFISVAVLVVSLRVLEVRSLALPLWVDSVHHSAIVRLILAQGGLPESYRPFADVDQVYYHLGYHVAVAILTRISGLTVEQTMLWFGQALQVVVCVGIYFLAARWTGRRSAALLAMIVPGTLSLMPAYYVTWGRYTQLAGLAILPFAMLSFAQAASSGRRRHLVLAAILAALLFWTHYRVTFFFATFVLAFLVVESATLRHDKQLIVRVWVRTVWITLLALLLCAPWLWRLWNTVLQPLGTLTLRIAGNDEYNAVPFDMLARPGMDWLLVAAAAGALVAVWRGGNFRRWSLVVLLWVAVTAVALNPGFLGARPTWIVNNFSAVIALFLPEALLIGLGFAALTDACPLTRNGQREGWLQVGITLLALATAPGMVDIVNPVTVLAERDDLVAMDWIRQNTAPDAIFAVNERLWQGQTYMGTDGGYWITNLTGRRTTMPIVFYGQGTPEYVNRVNRMARLIESVPDPDDPAFRAALRAWDVTYVYIGAKGGPLPLAKFLVSPYYRELYSVGAVHVFAVTN